MIDIIRLIEAGEKHSLLAELILSFGVARNMGLDVYEAVDWALEDWDVNDNINI